MADTRTSTTELVVDAVGRAYAAAGGTTVMTDLAEVADLDVPGRAVIAPELGVVECVMGDADSLTDIGHALARLAANGWAVTVLVPTHKLGEAHRDLRGRPAVAQGWWIDDDHIQFGRHETL